MWLLTAAALLVAALAGAQPAQVGCGPAQAGCGPAQIGGAATAPPSWVSATVGAWMLDEAADPRVNAQGNAARNLLTTSGTVTNDTVVVKEGTASALFDVSTEGLSASDPAFDALSSPLTIGCWHYPNALAGTHLSIVRVLATAGFQLGFVGTSMQFSVYDAGGVLRGSGTAPIAATTWTHFVGSYLAPTLTLFQNGAQVATAATAASSPAVATPLVVSSGWANGRLDECFVAATAFAPDAICRICSCGLRGERCLCAGAAFATTGRNATDCGACTLPADCSAGAPNLVTTTTVVTTSTTTTLAPLKVPVADATDSNCPVTALVKSTQSTSLNTLAASKTCATGANATGYDVSAIVLYVGTAVAGSHVQCSVWTYPAGYTSGTTSIPKVAATCDSTAWTSTVTPNAYVTFPIAGPCHLAPATRYLVGCNSDAAGGSAPSLGLLGSCTNCEQTKTSTYPGLLDPWTATGQLPFASAAYLTVTASP